MWKGSLHVCVGDIIIITDLCIASNIFGVKGGT